MRPGWCLALVSVVSWAFSCVSADPAQRSPVVLVPGIYLLATNASLSFLAPPALTLETFLQFQLMPMKVRRPLHAAYLGKLRFVWLRQVWQALCLKAG